MDLTPVTLEGKHVRLEPLSLEHTELLRESALDAELWRWTLNDVQNEDDLRAYIETAIAEREQDRSLPFAIVHAHNGKGIGSTRMGNISVIDRRLEIGWTWVGRRWQRTPVNTESKYLLLSYAFEKLSCVRVELKTNALNTRSRAAIERIGGVEEGTLRRHAVSVHGRWRDTVFYSILDGEWPEVKKKLEEMLER